MNDSLKQFWADPAKAATAREKARVTRRAKAADRQARRAAELQERRAGREESRRVRNLGQTRRREERERRQAERFARVNAPLPMIKMDMESIPVWSALRLSTVIVFENGKLVRRTLAELGDMEGF